MALADPQFPPLLTGHAVRAGTNPFQAARQGAAAGTFGAGDLVWSRAKDRVEVAIVLEPDIPLDRAIAMAPLAMVAIGDALGAIGPPNLGITYRWPDVIEANGATVGGVRIAAAGTATSDSVPAWLVVGLHLRLAFSNHGPEPGHRDGETALIEEGCGDLDRTLVTEAYARHFLSWIDGFETNGFRMAHQTWLFRSAERDAPVTAIMDGVPISGLMIGLDENGGLLVKTENGTRALSLVDALRAPTEDIAP